MYIPSVRMISVFIFLMKFSDFVSGVVPARRPNLYKWLAQNSYICDPTLLNKKSHRFLTPRESVRSKCSCGDPLITKAACGRRNGSRDKPKCFRLPSSCLQEYSIIFASQGNRLAKPPLPHHLFTRPPRRTTIRTRKRRPTTAAARKTTKKRPHQMPKIVSTIPVTTVLRVRKQRRPS